MYYFFHLDVSVEQIIHLLFASDVRDGADEDWWIGLVSNKAGDTSNDTIFLAGGTGEPSGSTAFRFLAVMMCVFYFTTRNQYYLLKFYVITFHVFVNGHVARLPAEDPAHRILSCRDPRGWSMPRGRPQASWLRQVEAYLKDTGMAGLTTAWAMARRPGEYSRKVLPRSSGVCPHT